MRQVDLSHEINRTFLLETSMNEMTQFGQPNMCYHEMSRVISLDKSTYLNE